MDYLVIVVFLESILWTNTNEMIFCYIVADEFDKKNSVTGKEDKSAESNNEKEKRDYLVQEKRFIS